MNNDVQTICGTVARRSFWVPKIKLLKLMSTNNDIILFHFNNKFYYLTNPFDIEIVSGRFV